jgi:glycosyltransferase 2 family protein
MASNSQAGRPAGEGSGRIGGGLGGVLFNLFKIAVSLGLIVYLLSLVDLQALWQLIVGADFWLLLLALGLYIGAITLGCVKWVMLLQPLQMSAPFSELLAYTFVGLFFGNVLPSNLGGDVVRAYDLATATRRPEDAAISVLVDRLMGLVAYFAAAVVMAVVTLLLLGGSMEMETIIVWVLIGFGALLFGLALLFSRRLTMRGAFLFDLPLLRAFRPTALRIFHALQAYRNSYGTLVRALTVSLAVMLLSSVVQLTIGRALGLAIPALYFFLFNPLIAFVLVVPVSVNGIGLKEAAFVFFFGLVGVARSEALSISLVFHAIIVASSLPGGLLWLRRRSLAPAAPRGKSTGGGEPSLPA